MKKVLLTLILSVGFLIGVVSAAAVEVGQKAPDFELPSTRGEKLKLSSLQGKRNVLIEFYVLDFTPT